MALPLRPERSRRRGPREIPSGSETPSATRTQSFCATTVNDELGDDRSSVQRLHYLEEQFRKVSGGLLLRLERPGDAGQRLLGERAKDGSNAAFEMEMDRGRTDAQRLGELAQAEPVCADALDQLGGGRDDRRFGQAGVGSGLPLFLNIWTRSLPFGYGEDGHDDARESRERGAPRANR